MQRKNEQWTVCQLGDIAKITSGGTPDRKNVAYWNGAIPWITTSLINFNHIKSAEEFITKEGLENSSAKCFPAGTVLLAMYGQGKTRGQVAILDIEATTNQACAAILTKPNTIINEYLFYNLTSRYKELRSIGHGGNQVNLNGDLLKQIIVEFPPIKTQKNTIKILSSWDKSIDTLTELLFHKKKLKHKLMLDILSGDKRLPGFSNSWDEPELGEIFNFVKTESFSRDCLTKMSSSRDILYIHYGDIHSSFSSEHLNIKQNRSLPVLKHLYCGEEFEFLREGDLVIADASEDYDGIGKAIEIINLGAKRVVGGLHTIVARDKAAFTAPLFRAYILGNRKTRLMLKRIAVGTSVYGISKGNIAKIKTFLPPLKEQIAIANFLFDSEKEIQVLQRLLSLYRKQKKSLMTHLLVRRG